MQNLSHQRHAPTVKPVAGLPDFGNSAVMRVVYDDSSPRHSRGFTLTELMITLAVASF